MSVVTEVRINSNPEISLKDELNRSITIKKPNRLAIVNYRLACGDSAKHLEEEIFVLPWIIAIGDKKISSPKALVDVKELIQDLDNEGYSCVIEGISKYLEENKAEDHQKKAKQ